MNIASKELLPNNNESFKEIDRYVSLEFSGISTAISEVGIDIAIIQVSTESMLCFEKAPTTLEIIEDNIKLKGKIIHANYSNKALNIRVMFEDTTLNQYRQLIKILFCRFDRWQRPQTPGELRILWLFVSMIINRIKNVLAIKKRKIF